MKLCGVVEICFGKKTQHLRDLSLGFKEVSQRERYTVHTGMHRALQEICSFQILMSLQKIRRFQNTCKFRRLWSGVGASSCMHGRCAGNMIHIKAWVCRRVVSSNTVLRTITSAKQNVQFCILARFSESNELKWP